MKKIRLLLITPLLALAACSSLPDWLGSGEKEKIAGDRISVMDNGITITTSDAIKNDDSDIPNAVDTPSSGTNSGNFIIAGDLSKIEKISAGDEPDNEFYLAYPPSIAENTVFIVDGHSNISAYDAETLKQKWSKKTDATKRDRDLPGGGISAAYGVLYTATGYGEILANSTADGSVIWKKNLGAPLRRPPVVANDKVFAVTIDNQLFALSVIDGSTVWRHSGVNETTSIYGSANTAIKNDIVIAAYSSGEIFGINAPRGNELWTELVSGNNDHMSAASGLNDVTASPVIIDGIVYIGGNSGNLDAFNAANGTRVWKQQLGPITTTPWVAGKYIYAIAQGYKLVALDRFDGRVKWVSNLPTTDKLDKRNFWSGPIMGGGKLLVVGSKGKLIELDPQDGKTLRKIEIPDGIYSAPVIAYGKLYMLTREAKLVQVK